jgi:alpha-beta hydrolase superfamily lysophospholipase
MTATPLWFGPKERPLFGWWHVPDGGRARGGVVLCPPFGMEAAAAGPALRRLAQQFEEEGFVVLRFDYDGTGDSAGGTGDPGRVDAWLSGIQAAVDLVLACGVARVALVGLRMGATLAAVGATRGTKVDAIALWDPCPSGRSFLRHERLMREVIGIGEVADDGSVEGPGIVFPAETVRELSDLAIEDTEGMLAPDVLVLTRSDHKANKAMVSRLSMDHVRFGEVSGQADLIDVPPVFARIPEPDLLVMVSWLSNLWNSNDTAVDDPLTVGASEKAAVGHDRKGGVIWERAIRLGPHGLFGIVTESEREGAKTTALLLPAGVLDHTGPARLWVDLARVWSGAGLRVVRVDTGGVGESPPRGGQSNWFVRSPETVDDVADVIGQLTVPGEKGIVLIGICSGGYHACEAALAFPLLGILMVNPSFASRREGIDHTPPGVRREAPPSTRRWAKALPAHDFLSRLIYGLPSWVWWIINRIAVTNAPATTLRRIADRGTEVVLVCNTPDAWQATRGGRRALGRLGRRGRMQIEVFDDIEHTLLCRDGREKVVALLTEHVEDRYGI